MHQQVGTLGVRRGSSDGGIERVEQVVRHGLRGRRTRQRQEPGRRNWRGDAVAHRLPHRLERRGPLPEPIGPQQRELVVGGAAHVGAIGRLRQLGKERRGGLGVAGIVSGAQQRAARLERRSPVKSLAEPVQDIGLGGPHQVGKHRQRQRAIGPPIRLGGLLELRPALHPLGQRLLLSAGAHQHIFERRPIDSAQVFRDLRELRRHITQHHDQLVGTGLFPQAELHSAHRRQDHLRGRPLRCNLEPIDLREPLEITGTTRSPAKPCKRPRVGIGVGRGTLKEQLRPICVAATELCHLGRRGLECANADGPLHHLRITRPGR